MVYNKMVRSLRGRIKGVEGGRVGNWRGENKRGGSWSVGLGDRNRCIMNHYAPVPVPKRSVMIHNEPLSPPPYPPTSTPLILPLQLPILPPLQPFYSPPPTPSLQNNLKIDSDLHKVAIRSINTKWLTVSPVYNLPQNPFTGKFLRWQHFALVSI